MKIGFVFDDSLDRQDGVQQYVKTMGRWLIKSGHEVRFLVGETHNAGDLQPYVYSLSRNVSVRANKNSLSVPLLANRKKIKEILNAEKFDVLHIQAPFNPLLAGRVIKLCPTDIGVVATFHIVGGSSFENIGLKILSFVQKRSLRRVDEFLAVSVAAEEASESYFPARPRISPNAIDISRFKNQLKETEKSDEKSILFLGRLVPRKGTRQLIEAFAKIDNANIKLTIAGDGPMREELVNLAGGLGVAQRVIFLGSISEKDKPQLLAEADLAVFPSTGGESFGIVLIEAMASGTLTLGGNNEGYRTVLDGPKEMLINPGQTTELARRIEMLLYNLDKRTKILAWQANRVKDFDVEKVGLRLLQHYRSARQYRHSLSK